jgi:hypothetical protein
MATMDQEERKVSFELLKKFGMRWAVLTALGLDMGGQGVSVPAVVWDELKLARMKILSGCFSPCEVNCALGKVEGKLISVGARLGPDYLRPWFELLADAMEGRIDPGRIHEIPALQPVATDCQFLRCQCG